MRVFSFSLSLSFYLSLFILWFTSYSGDQIPNCGEAVEIHLCIDHPVLQRPPYFVG